MTDRKTQIKQAALSVFALYGLRRTSMQDVAVEAGLSRPALYQYFRNKEDLIAACIDMVTEEGFAQSEVAAATETNPVGQIAAYLAAYMIYYHRLLISGPHSEDMLAITTRFGDTKINAVRQKLAAQLNARAGLGPDDQIGVILAHSAEGLKRQAVDEATLEQQIKTLVAAFVSV